MIHWGVGFYKNNDLQKPLTWEGNTIKWLFLQVNPNTIIFCFGVQIQGKKREETTKGQKRSCFQYNVRINIHAENANLHHWLVGEVDAANKIIMFKTWKWHNDQIETSTQRTYFFKLVGMVMSSPMSLLWHEVSMWLEMNVWTGMVKCLSVCCSPQSFIQHRKTEKMVQIGDKIKCSDDWIKIYYPAHLLQFEEALDEDKLSQKP